MSSQSSTSSFVATFVPTVKLFQYETQTGSCFDLFVEARPSADTISSVGQEAVSDFDRLLFPHFGRIAKESGVHTLTSNSQPEQIQTVMRNSVVSLCSAIDCVLEDLPESFSTHSRVFASANADGDRREYEEVVASDVQVSPSTLGDNTTECWMGTLSSRPAPGTSWAREGINLFKNLFI